MILDAFGRLVRHANYFAKERWFGKTRSRTITCRCPNYGQLISHNGICATILAHRRALAGYRP